MGLYEVPLSSVFVGFWDRDYVQPTSIRVRYYVVVKSMLHEKSESKRTYVF